MNSPAEKTAVLVTGGSRGIGAAVAELAAAKGHAVAIVYRDKTAEAQALVDRIGSAGGRALAIQADIAKERDIERAFDLTQAAFGRIGGLVNNAGITGGASTVSGVGEAQLAQLFAVNVAASFLCVREAVKHMATDCGQAGGAIVNVSSRAACLGAAGVWVHYAATKGAVDTMTLGLARELAPRGIRVNAVRPGFIATDIHAQRSEELMRSLVATVPMARMGRAAEVAAAILWLLSEEASYVTGAILDVAGGA